MNPEEIENNDLNTVESPESLELGIQPLDKLMEDLGLKNTDLVRAGGNQLSHKVVGKARKGRRITKKAKLKVLHGFNQALIEGEISQNKYSLTDLFNY